MRTILTSFNKNSRCITFLILVMSPVKHLCKAAQVSWHCHLHTDAVFYEPKTHFFKNTQLEFIAKVDTSAVIEPHTLTKRCLAVLRDPPNATETKL